MFRNLLSIVKRLACVHPLLGIVGAIAIVIVSINCTSDTNNPHSWDQPSASVCINNVHVAKSCPEWFSCHEKCDNFPNQEKCLEMCNNAANVYPADRLDRFMDSLSTFDDSLYATTLARIKALNALKKPSHCSCE